VTETDHLVQHLRRVFKLAAPAAALLHFAAIASVWGEWLSVAMIAGQTAAIIALNAAVAPLLLRRYGNDVSENVRFTANTLDILAIGFLTGWGLVYWLWLPYFALFQEGLTSRHHRVRFAVTTTALIAGPIVMRADTLALGAGLTLIAALTHLVGATNARLARDMLAERARHFDDLRRAQADLVRASHSAGMAEVATGVLHNVGNVLASINVSASMLANLARSDNTTRLNKAMVSIGEHADPVKFLTESGRAHALVAYLGKLATGLSRERDDIAAEVASIRRNVEHIKQIVQRQQSVARAGGFAEELRIGDIIADAVALTAASKGAHPVHVDVDASVHLVADRHKVAQILTNLLANARDAIADSQKREIRVHVWPADERCVAISVADSGIGIAPDNLARIFSYGFTSKPDGHGFGLHASACAAIELGGRLSVESAGIDQGATFTLTLPADRSTTTKVAA
jgi:signal transduction histidine kinase